MKNIKKAYKNSKCKISVPTWNEEFELPDELYSISDIQDYFEFILKNMEKKLLKQWSTKASTKIKITKDENGENVPYLEIDEVVFTQCNVVSNSYPQSSRVLYTFVPHKSFGQLLDILPISKMTR